MRRRRTEGYPGWVLSWGENGRLTDNSHTGNSGKGRREAPSWGKSNTRSFLKVSNCTQMFGFFTSEFSLHNYRLSCPPSEPQDSTRADYSECKPEQHKVHSSICDGDLTENGFINSHLIADGQLEWPQTKGERGRVVPGEEAGVFAHALRDAPAWAKPVRNTSAEHKRGVSQRVSPLVGDDGVNLAVVLQLGRGSSVTFLHEQQQGLMGLLVHWGPYRHVGAQGDDTGLGHAG